MSTVLMYDDVTLASCVTLCDLCKLFSLGDVSTMLNGRAHCASDCPAVANG